MATSLATVTLNIQWTPPGAQVGSGNSAYTTQLSYNGQNVGSLDIQTTTPITTIMPIPFGPIVQAKVVIIRNNMSSDIGIRLNGAVADQFRLASNAEFVMASPTAPIGAPTGLITSASITTTAQPLSVENVSFWVFGD